MAHRKFRRFVLDHLHLPKKCLIEAQISKKSDIHIKLKGDLMLRYWGFISLLLLSTGVRAQVENGLSWTALKAAAERATEETESPFGLFRTMTRRTPTSPEGAYLIEHFSAVGGVAADGTFGSNRFELVWEDWTINEAGNLVVDQWLFRLGPDGRIRLALHNGFEKRISDSVVINFVRADANEELEIKKLNELLGRWYSQLSALSI